MISIDPVTRIEGHLRVDVEIDGQGKVINAWSSGTMFRGLEMLIQGKHPWDAQQVMERICGVCPLVHGTAASTAIDDALGVNLPQNANLIRNLCLGANYIQSHILHFYHLAALDYIDVTAIAKYNGSNKELLLVKDKVAALLALSADHGGDPLWLAPFFPRYESSDYLTDPTLVTQLVANYIAALDARKKAQEMLTIFYGRMPSFVGTIPGGVTTPPTVSNVAAFKSRLQQLVKFIEEVYVPNVVTVANAFSQFMTVGDSGGNYLSYGWFNQEPKKNPFLPGGTIMGMTKMAPFNDKQIVEQVKYSWYSSECTRPPASGKTEPEPEKAGAYSFLKAPRYDGNAMEVGPMARMLVLLTNTSPAVAPQRDALIAKINALGLAPVLKLDKFGLVPRHGMRALECWMLANEMFNWLTRLDIGGPIWDDKPIPNEAQGKGLVEGPRGALGHWINIKGSKTENYQAVVPTTWNASPRGKDDSDKGPIEKALIGIPIGNQNTLEANMANPINVARVIRSFDPCIACAVHIIHPENNSLREFRVV